ncbi:coiled-coil domain-containing protein 60 isoform X1 [Cygnus atratus]|uniref:coiled-coil domain-containing protein 60 isoform X1 n=1 Tax=Cygnus atratus TaxID=8868 RepID=UPI0015D65991|nr:coiled-coil domain-containing protein 60 isoform X1 [Cygnus atratus]
MPAPDTPQSSKVEAPVATSTGKSSRPKAPLLPDSTKTSRVKVLAATKVSNPQDFVHIQALPGVAQKEGRVLARSRRIYRSSEPSRKQVFWENYHRRQEQFTQGHVTPTGKPYQELGEILYTDPKKLTLYSLGQLTQEPAKKDVRERPRKEVAKVPTNKYSFNPKSDPPESVKRLASFRETGKELRTLSKALAQSRHHVNAVKKGGAYFHILHQESLERKNILNEQQAQGVRWGTDFQPPTYFSDPEESGEEISTCSLTEGNHLKKSGKKKKKMTLRSFTPAYTSVLIPRPPEAKSEHLFRQLCAIHWLLEALTLESNSSMHSILTCWNPMDPGGCKKTVKEMEEEKLVAFMWELFVTNTKKDMRKARHCPLSRKTNKISTPVISQLSSQSSHGQTPHGSVNSLVLCSEDNVNVNGGLSDVMSESVQTKEQHHLFPSLQKLIQIPHGDVSKDVPEQEDMVEKTGLQRSQEERCSQKYQALKRLKHFRKDMERLRQLDVRAEREHVEDEIKWFPVLLARLPESVKNDHYVKKILKKLEKFGMTPDLKIHHDTFLKALTDLQVWELCSPEIAAAVEFVRESIVQMPEEDFSEWFRTRVAPLSARASTF